MRFLHAIWFVLLIGLALSSGMARQVASLPIQEPDAQSQGIKPIYGQEPLLAQAATERPRRVAPARRARPDTNERIQPRQGSRPQVVRPGGRPAGIGRPQGARPQAAPRPRRR